MHFLLCCLPCADPSSQQRPADRQPSAAVTAEGTFAAAPPVLRSSFGSWWSQNVASSGTAAALQEQSASGPGYPSVNASAAGAGSGQGQGEQPSQHGPRLSSSQSFGLGIHDSAASAGGSAHGVTQGRESLGGVADLRDSSQGLGASPNIVGGLSFSQGGGPMRASVDQSDTSSVSSVSVSGVAATPGSVSAVDQSGMPVTVAGSTSSLGGLSGATSGAVSTPGPVWEAGGGPAAPPGGFLANWSTGSGDASNPSGSGGASGLSGLAGLHLSAYYASRPSATGLLGGQRGLGVAAALREEAGWLSGPGGIGRNSPRPTREPPSPVLRGLVTRPELALCLLTEVRPGLQLVC